MTKRKKQTELPGMEKPTHTELDALLELHAEKTSAMGELRQAIGELNEKLLAKAEELGLTVYRNDTAVPPLLLTITKGASKLKVQPARGAPQETDDDFDAGDSEDDDE